MAESLCDSPSLLDQRCSFSLVSTSRGATRLQEITDCRSYVRQNVAVTQSGSPRSGERSYAVLANVAT